MLLEELPIAVDSFSHRGAEVLFFCSHAHADHLVGLHGRWQRGCIYCSPVTARLLELRWPALGARLRPLTLGVTHSLTLGGADGPPLRVLLLDAHHVPGAVMFLFSGDFGTLLHTGDFRWHPEHVHLCSLPLLRGGLARIFLDNTFCHPAFEHPPREVVAAEAAATAASKWPCVLFVCGYRLGTAPGDPCARDPGARSRPPRLWFLS